MLSLFFIWIPLGMLCWYALVFFGTYSSARSRSLVEIRDRLDSLDDKNQRLADKIVIDNRPDYSPETLAAKERQANYEHVLDFFGGEPTSKGLHRHYLVAKELARSGEEAAIQKYGQKWVDTYWRWLSSEKYKRWKKENANKQTNSN